MKICLGIPTNRNVKAKTVLSLLEMVAASSHQFHFVCATEGYTVAENRTYIVAQAQKANCDFLLFVDDDMTFPPDTLERLLVHKKEIIGVNSHSRMLPLKTTVELPDGVTEVPKELFEAKAVGAGVLLVDMKIFEKLEKPWFAFETYDFGMTRMGEDSWFCRQAGRAGYGVWCDPTLEIGHIGDFTF